MITLSGNFGFLKGKPIKSLASSSKESFLASTNCIIDVAENDFEMEAILKIQSSVSGVLASIFFCPKEWLYIILLFFTTATDTPTTLVWLMMVRMLASASASWAITNRGANK